MVHLCDRTVPTAAARAHGGLFELAAILGSKILHLLPQLRHTVGCGLQDLALTPRRFQFLVSRLELLVQLCHGVAVALSGCERQGEPLFDVGQPLCRRIV